MSIDYRPDNTFIFSLARMNPPTPGHLYLIRRLIQEAMNKNVNDVYVILSKTNDNDENPISCKEKINVLGTIDDISKTMINSEKQRMIDETTDSETKEKLKNINVHALCVPDIKGATPFTPLSDILKTKRDIPDINLFLIIGDDRAVMLDSISDFFYKKWDNIKSVDGLVLPREEMSVYKDMVKDPSKLDSLNISEVPIGAISASFVRNIVKNHRRDKFTELYSPYLEESKIPVLYEEILNGVESLPPNKSSNAQSKPLKYTYPMIKGSSSNSISEYEQPVKKKARKTPATYGGRKSKKNKRKITKKIKKRINNIKTKKYRQ
jgi:nicotinic acid mononucleotide adenylyltransferase